MRLTENDYNKILKFYKIKHYKKMNITQKKHLSNKLVAKKLCSCIKTIKKRQRSKREKDIIPICKNSVLRKKGLIASKFTCKRKKNILLKKIKKTRRRNRK